MLSYTYIPKQFKCRGITRFYAYYYPKHFRFFCTKKKPCHECKTCLT